MAKKFDWRKHAARIVPPTGEDGFQHVRGAKVVEERPPVYESCCAVFRVTPRTVFTYGDVLYNPFKLHLSDDLVEHEKEHMRQQRNNPKDAALWWGRYLREPLFRVDQEARAYGRQYAFLASRSSDREQLAKWLSQLAATLSGPLYGSCVTHEEAAKLIKQHADAGL